MERGISGSETSGLHFCSLRMMGFCWLFQAMTFTMHLSRLQPSETTGMRVCPCHGHGSQLEKGGVFPLCWRGGLASRAGVKYLGFLFTSDGRLRSVVVKKELL